MTVFIMLFMAAAIVLPLAYIARRHAAGKTVRSSLIAHCFCFFGLVAIATIFAIVASPFSMATL